MIKEKKNSKFSIKRTETFNLHSKCKRKTLNLNLNHVQSAHKSHLHRASVFRVKEKKPAHNIVGLFGLIFIFASNIFYNYIYVMYLQL